MKRFICLIALVSIFATAAIAQETCETPCDSTQEKSTVVQFAPDSEYVGIMVSDNSVYGSVGIIETGDTFVYGFGLSTDVDQNVTLFAGPVFGVVDNEDNLIGGINVGMLVKFTDSKNIISVSYNRLTDLTLGVGASW